MSAPTIGLLQHYGTCLDPLDRRQWMGASWLSRRSRNLRQVHSTMTDMSSPHLGQHGPVDDGVPVSCLPCSAATSATLSAWAKLQISHTGGRDVRAGLILCGSLRTSTAWRCTVSITVSILQSQPLSLRNASSALAWSMALVVAGLPVEGAGVHVEEAHELLHIEDGLAVVVGPPACSVIRHTRLEHGTLLTCTSGSSPKRSNRQQCRA
jgi:hypothetical protein